MLSIWLKRLLFSGSSFPSIQCCHISFSVTSLAVGGSSDIAGRFGGFSMGVITSVTVFLTRIFDVLSSNVFLCRGSRCSAGVEVS